MEAAVSGGSHHLGGGLSLYSTNYNKKRKNKKITMKPNPKYWNNPTQALFRRLAPFLATRITGSHHLPAVFLSRDRLQQRRPLYAVTTEEDGGGSWRRQRGEAMTWWFPATKFLLGEQFLPAPSSNKHPPMVRYGGDTKTTQEGGGDGKAIRNTYTHPMHGSLSRFPIFRRHSNIKSWWWRLFTGWRLPKIGLGFGVFFLQNERAPDGA